MPWRSVRRTSVRQLFTFWTSSQEWLKGYTPNLPQMFLMRSDQVLLLLSRFEIQYGQPGLWSVDTFWTSSEEHLKGSTPNVPQMFLMRSWPSVVTFLCRSEIQYCRHGLWLADTFWTSSQEQLKGSCHKCSLPQMFLMRSRPSVVTFFKKSIWNPIWPPWSLISWHILNFWWRTAEGIYTTRATHCSLWGPNQVL